MSLIQAFVPAKIVQTFAAFLEFCYIACRNVISEDSLKQLDSALHRFHEARQIFSGTVRADGPSAFSLPRQHAMVHYHDHIQNFGSPNGLCSSITESKHITAVKRPWRRSNEHLALPQILRCNQRLDKLAAARVDFTTRGMLTDSCLIQAIKEATMDCDSEDPIDEVMPTVTPTVTPLMKSGFSTQTAPAPVFKISASPARTLLMLTTSAPVHLAHLHQHCRSTKMMKTADPLNQVLS